MKTTVLQHPGGTVFRNWKKILAVTVLFTLLAMAASALLFQNLRFSWIDLVPEKSRAVQQYNSIIKQFKSASALIVTVQGANRNDVEKAITFAGRKLQQQAGPINSVMYRMPVDFLKKNRLLLTKTKDLKRTAEHLTGFSLVPFMHGINDLLEDAWVGDSKGLRRQEKDASAMVNTFHDYITLLEMTVQQKRSPGLLNRVATGFTSGPEYMVSADGTFGILTVFPGIPVEDIKGSVKLANRLDRLFEQWEKQLPGIKFGQTGMHTMTRDEMRTSEQDSMVVTMLAFVLIIILMIFAFRIPSAPLLGMLSLFCGIVWTFGLTWLVIGSLNLMTAMVAAILLGLGIDYSVHFLSQYSEARASGCSVEESLDRAYRRSGRGLILGALTTAVAFLVLAFIPFRALGELGLVTALGVIATAVSSLILLPALLCLREARAVAKNRPAKQIYSRIPQEYRFLSRSEALLNRKPLLTVVITLLLTGLFFWQALSLQFTGDLKEIEAAGIPAIVNNDLLQKKLDMTSDSVMAVSKSIGQDRLLWNRLDRNPLIAQIDSISAWLPSAEQQRIRRKIITAYRRKITAARSVRYNSAKFATQLNRFYKNLLELRDMARLGGLVRLERRITELLDDNGTNRGGRLVRLHRAIKNNKGVLQFERLNASFEQRLRRATLAMTTPQQLTLDKLPRSVVDRVVSRDGKQFLLTAWLQQDVWKTVGTGKTVGYLQRSAGDELTGMVIFMDLLIKTAAETGRDATLIALAAIFVLVTLDFRRLRLSIPALLNLLFACIWMFGIGALLNIKLNFMNILALPLIIGIGIDDSVHIIHRFRRNGCRDFHRVLVSTGRAVFLTSITTMIGFGSLTFARFRGFQSFGLLLFIGVAAALLLSVIFLPALLRLLYRRNSNGGL